MSSSEVPPEVRVSNLLESILRRTNEGAISWVATDSENAFLFSGRSSSVRSYTYWDDNWRPEEPEYGVSFLNSRGQVVESIDSQSQSDQQRLLRELYESARRSALNYEGVLADIEESLVDPPPPKSQPSRRSRDLDEEPF